MGELEKSLERVDFIIAHYEKIGFPQHAEPWRHSRKYILKSIEQLNGGDDA